MTIVVVDLGMGNLRSVANGLAVVAPDEKVIISHSSSDVAAASRIVLPGQGAIKGWFDALNRHDLEQSLRSAIANKPVLAICVGMQALYSWSEEGGGVKGLGVLDGSVTHFKNFHASLAPLAKIPHMGWNTIQLQRRHSLWQGIEDDSYFYFVHSYCANISADQTSEQVAATCDYQHEFIAAAITQNIFAVQFHPEKSHTNGLRLLQNFVAWDGSE